MKIRPYVSLDLETTGLDTENSQILQVGMVLDNGVSPIEELETVNFLVKNQIITYGEAYAISMNHWIFKEYNNKDTRYEIQDPEIAIQKIAQFLEKGAKLAEQFDIEQGEKYPKRKVQVAGKNVGTFDIPIVVNQAIANGLNKSIITAPCDHRTIDVGSMYFDVYGKNAGLNKINKLVGREAVTHDALDDALDVVYAIRNKLQEN